ncbi:MAG: hypothetical protein K1X83_04820 [Oligoflexia bacterium]|nr:hypothetical protein [Oligoflexia bacterium]
MRIRTLVVLGGLAYFLNGHSLPGIPTDFASSASQFIANADRYMSDSFRAVANSLPNWNLFNFANLRGKNSSIADAGYEAFDFRSLRGSSPSQQSSSPTLDFGALANPKKLSELSFAKLPEGLSPAGEVSGLPLGAERDDPLGILR